MDADFLARELRRADYDRYLLTLYEPAAARPGLWALFLLNHDIARTRPMVTDTNLGHIRLQWWRDEIAKVYQGGSGGTIPALSTLAPVIHAKRLSFDLFEALLFAREFDLEDVAPATLDGLRNYCCFITTPLNRLALEILGNTAPLEEIEHISQNFGLVQLMRNIPAMTREGRCFLPQDFLETRNLNAQKIIDFNHQEKIAEIVGKIVSSIVPYKNPQSRFLRRQQKMTELYLKQMKKYKFDVFSARMKIPPAFLPLCLLAP